MKPAAFAYHRPRSLDEAAELIARLGPEDGRILAGGQSLVPTMAFRLAQPEHLIDINRVDGLDLLEVGAETLEIGAIVRHAAFHRPVEDGPLGRLLAFVAGHVAHYPIRMRGTFCGSLAHADPASEWCVVAATLDAGIVALGPGGERRVAADVFLDGIMTTTLAEDELVTRAVLPRLSPDTRFGFYEVSRRAGDYALAMALTVYRVEDGRIVAPRLGLGGAEERARRIPRAEAALEGKAPGPDAFAEAAEAAAAAIEPLEDMQADAAFRRDLVRAVTRRALERSAP